jgi:hypothetical protein
MRYPIEKATSIPGSGNAFYFFLIENIHIPAKLTHDLWYKGCEELRVNPTHPFQGFFPVGSTLRISYASSPMGDYTFTGDEKNPVFVKDLSPEAMLELGISAKSKPSDKVFNPLFRLYEELPEKTRKDNELPSLSLAKSITSFLSSSDMLFTEKDIVEFLIKAIENANSPQMRHILHGNHVAWCAARFMSTGVMEEDIKKNFYGQNEIEFYIKDVGTIMPAILYSFALLGVDPVDMINRLDYDLWGVDKAAKELQNFMLINKKETKAA